MRIGWRGTRLIPGQGWVRGEISYLSASMFMGFIDSLLTLEETQLSASVVFAGNFEPGPYVNFIRITAVCASNQQLQLFFRSVLCDNETADLKYEVSNIKLCLR